MVTDGFRVGNGLKQGMV